MRPRHLLVLIAIAIAFAGCASGPQANPVVQPVPPVEVPTVPATIRGSEESSALLDNFTAFIISVDGRPITAGRAGWNTPIELKPGHHYLAVAFKRGVFGATAQLELQAASGVNYQLNYSTDAQLFGRNSYCDFWVTDLAAGRQVTATVKAPVEKGN